MVQPIVDAFASEWCGRVRVQPGWLVHHQQMFVFKKDQRRIHCHASFMAGRGLQLRTTARPPNSLQIHDKSAPLPD
jgi:hypothetical protein